MIAPRPIQFGERASLERFADGLLSLQELLHETNGMLCLEFHATERRLTSHFAFSEPGIKLSFPRLKAAEHHLRSVPHAKDAIVGWATMLLLNEQYEWDGDTADGAAVNDLLHRLSMPEA